MTQSELAHKVGIAQGHISSIEQGKIDVRVSTLVQLARILNQEVMLVPHPFIPRVQALLEGKKDLNSKPLWQLDEEEE
jgi:HTH-type transcriptional regulator/antitoxin HipB